MNYLYKLILLDIAFSDIHISNDFDRSSDKVNKPVDSKS